LYEAIDEPTVSHTQLAFGFVTVQMERTCYILLLGQLLSLRLVQIDNFVQYKGVG